VNQVTTPAIFCADLARIRGGPALARGAGLVYKLDEGSSGRRDMAALIRLADQDNVAVATTNLAQGVAVEVDGATLTTRDPIPFAHKIAIRAIEAGAQVLKYGVPIGRAKVRVEPGQHVHVHNIKSDYVNNEVDFFEEPAVGEPARGAAS
jgi:altronate dehydratase